MEFGVQTVAALVVLTYILAELIKATPLDTKWLPGLCGLIGAVLGVVSLHVGVMDFPAQDPITAAAVGGASGLAATGCNQIYKKLFKNDNGKEETP